MALQEYTINHLHMLALLPKAFRERLLHTIPVVDVCRLEGTPFTKGIDMEEVWKKLYKEYIRPQQLSKTKPSWREEFFATLTRSILSGSRPYGYFKGRSHQRLSDRYWAVVRGVTEEGTVQNCPVDIVNYLVAVKQNSSSEAAVCNVKSKSLTIHEATKSKGVVPPGKVYNEACRARQLVPPRYTKLFPEGSCYLPDSTALELISRECHYRPKEISASVQESDTLLLRLEHERGNLDVLREFFSEVESLTLEGETKRDTPSRLLDFVANSSLTDLAITDGILQTSMTIKYSELKRLSFNVRKTVSKHALISITEQQTSLHTVSLYIENRDDDITLYLSMALPWLQTCFKRLSIKHVHVRIYSLRANPGSILQILAAFLSTTSSSEQILTVDTDRQDTGELIYKPKDLPHHPYRFNDAITQHKSLELNHICYIIFDSSFARRPLKLKKLVVNAGGGHLSQLPHRPLLLMEELSVASLDMRKYTQSDYSTLFQKKSLKKVTFGDCIGNTSHHNIIRIASQTGFNLTFDERSYTFKTP